MWIDTAILNLLESLDKFKKLPLNINEKVMFELNVTNQGAKSYRVTVERIK